jgi:PucR family transcriptional regulator, purine catabolism regulatory protein
MATTMSGLLDDPQFDLRLLVAPTDPAVLAAPVEWAHSSDLADPTPWLEPGQLLLTDGEQFLRWREQEQADAYVARLVARRVLALGFATDILHETVPAILVEAARRHDLPLVEVAGRTPFMAIIRHVADEVAREQRERLEWSLDAQRAIARAALRPDGLAAILHELERRLDCWAALYDPAGEIVLASPTHRMPAAQAPAVAEAVHTTLRRGLRAGARLADPSGEVTLQTLGQRSQLLGVLAVGTSTPLDAAGVDLVASVIGFASIALEQSRALDAARQELRTSVLELLLEGRSAAAEGAATALGAWLPGGAVRLVVIDREDADAALVGELEQRAGRGHGPFFAFRDDALVIVVSDATAQDVEEVLRGRSIRAGVSGPRAADGLAGALPQAERALAAASGRQSVVRFDELARAGMQGALGRADGAAVAAELLRPATDGTSADGPALLACARTWLEFNGAWDPAARALGIHRHTLRARIEELGRMLELDLDGFDGRAELWMALRMAG